MNYSRGPESETLRSPSPAAADTGRKTRRYAFACTNCKARKVRCSGKQPICRACHRNGDACTWPVSMEGAEARLQEANARIKRLEASLRDAVASSSVASHNSVPDISASITSAIQSGISSSTNGTLPASATPLWFEVGIGEDGSVIYNGPTSRFHAGPLEEGEDGEGEDHQQMQREAALEDQRRAAHMQTLRSQYDLLDTVWSPLIAAKPVLNSTGVDTAEGMILLDVYWTWLHPLHNCVYRPCFIMDMALGGPCYSDFLLMCILAVAARHLPKERENIHGISKGDDFVGRAKQLLLTELSDPSPRIPTIQGLLILGSRQCAVGKSSEAWLYTGMAIRMMVDIGLHLDINKLAQLERLTPAEIETRKRLFNSAYIWDKTLSLALGRPPSLTRRPYPPEDILDTFDDMWEWTPVHALEINIAYTATHGLRTATFSAFCSLHILTTDMMLLFASTSRIEDFTAKISHLDSRYCQWYDELRSDLKISEPTTLLQSPPPHIVSLNLLYHTLHILLRRPYLSSSDTAIRTQAMRICATHSHRIHELHNLYSRTFPHRLMTCQVSYCIYTAATIDAQELKSAIDSVSRDSAAARLATAVRILQEEAQHTPGSGRSLETIRRLLGARGLNISANNRISRRASHYESPLRQQSVQRSHNSTARAVRGDRDGKIGIQQNQQHDQGWVSEQSSPSMESFVDDYWIGMFGLGGFGTGAGFRPDAISWGASNASVNMPMVPVNIDTDNVLLHS